MTMKRKRSDKGNEAPPKKASASALVNNPSSQTESDGFLRNALIASEISSVSVSNSHEIANSCSLDERLGVQTGGGIETELQFVQTTASTTASTTTATSAAASKMVSFVAKSSTHSQHIPKKLFVSVGRVRTGNRMKANSYCIVVLTLVVARFFCFVSFWMLSSVRRSQRTQMKPSKRLTRTSTSH